MTADVPVRFDLSFLQLPKENGEVISDLDNYILKLFEFKEKAAGLKAVIKKDPYNMKAHMDLADLYRAIGWFAEAGDESAIVEFLDKMNRNLKNI